MSIKSTVKSDPPTVARYPKLRKGKFTDIIVLFINSNCGTVVHNAGRGGPSAGTYSEFNSENFDDYNGCVTLSNGD